MPKKKTYFPQVPVVKVEKIAKVDIPKGVKKIKPIKVKNGVGHV